MLTELLVENVRVTGGYPWFMTVVNKADLWLGGQSSEVERHYNIHLKGGNEFGELYKDVIRAFLFQVGTLNTRWVLRYACPMREPFYWKDESLMSGLDLKTQEVVMHRLRESIFDLL